MNWMYPDPVLVFLRRYYSAVGPRTIRPNSEYHCAISLHGTSEPTGVTATLQGTSNNGTPFMSQDFVIVQPYSSQICRMEVGDLEPGEYKLEVRGSSGLDFLTEYLLQFVEKSYSVFIQTDRQVYQPGTKVSFRAIVLNSQLKPAAEVRDEYLWIHISDGDGNRVKEWQKVQAVRGVFTGELELSKSPVLGNWNISVEINGQTYSKTIQVAEYVMPKFLVNIQTPKHVTFKENVITVNIESRNMYGRDIHGEATVSVYPTIYSGVIQPIFQNPVRKVLPINGTATVEFDIDRDLGLNDEYERIVVVDVVVEEKPTGRRQNNSVEVHIHKYDYQMELIKTADYFKPGLQYTAYVKLTKHDGTPLTDNADVTVRHGYSRVDEVYEVQTHKLGKNGMITLQYTTPSNATNNTALRIEAEFRDLKVRMPPVPTAVSYSNSFLQASVQTDRPMVNLDVEISVSSTEPLRYINYVLMGRGDVLLTHTFHIDDKKDFMFHFVATHAMVPVCHLIVYYVRPDGEFVGDALDIEIDGLLQNFVDVQVNTLETEPDLDVELTVRAQQNSYVGLLAVDENVGLLREGYDITATTISEELKSYDVAEGTPYPQFNKNSKSQFIWRPGASNPHSAIYESGADLLTNAQINRHKPTLEDIYLRPVFYGASTVKPDRGLGLPPALGDQTAPGGSLRFQSHPATGLEQTEGLPDPGRCRDLALHQLLLRLRGESFDKEAGSRFAEHVVHHRLLLGSAPRPGLGHGEILAVPVVVNNYMNQDVNVDVTLHNQGQEFEFAEISNEINATKKIELYRRKKIRVKKNTSAAVSFMITPTKLGPVEIKATANSPRTQDVVVKQMRVLAEGETEYYTKSMLMDLRDRRDLKTSLNFTVPKNAVPGSEKIEVCAVGNFLGPAMIHLEDVIRLPSDCGEQNLVHFMPNLIILQYLSSTRQLNPTVYNEAVSNLETSYQQQLTYKREDGSFSPFGVRDATGSVWLTAYVALALRQAKPFIYVDEEIVERALSWLVEAQGQNGSFYETGNVIYEDLQSRDGNSLPLTAFTVIALIESNQRSNPFISNAINRGLDYLARNIDEGESSYSVALCSYALQLSKHASRQSAFNLLDAKSKSKGTTKWWSKEVPADEAKNPWHKLPRSIDIETTSYALLSFVEAGLLEDAVPVLEWLINQQNNLGGFASSQDTVVGMHALYKLVTRLASPTNIQVEYEYGDKETGKFSINKNNAIFLLNAQISNRAREVNVTAQGTGLAVFRVSYQYNMNVTGPWPMFTLDPQVDKNSNTHHLQVSICAAFVSPNLTDSGESNMAVMEVTLPSGFTADVDSLPSLEVSQNVQKVETRNGLTKIILYFNNITRNEYCPTVSAFRTHKVAKQKPVPVVIYDYYDSSRRARVFYSGPKATLCDICDDEDCGDVCVSQPRTLTQESNRNGKPGSGANLQITTWTLLLSLGVMIYR
ncbi:hypothetical protein NQ318_020139 [Aromia moschata]|uniref:TEP1-F n=1 Tax=Aromia moschata TaxID=1265417 RepID=A0AAV8Z9H6_9CUCU|nr:hypothetical protein NQ318_020139 [Aromia moschata]